MKLVRRVNYAQNPVQHLFDSLINDDHLVGPNLFNSKFDPAVNIKETKDSFLIDLVAPGFTKEDFSLEFKEDHLIVKTDIKESSEKSDSEDKWTRREFRVKSFSKSFILPEHLINEEKISATYSNGILQIELQKAEDKKAKEAKQIPIL